MIRQPTVALLREMRLSAMAAELERQTADEESYRELFFEDRLAMLVDAEWSRRQSNKFARCLRNVRFAIPSGQWKESNIMQIGNLTRSRCFSLHPAGILNPDITSFSREPAGMARPISPVLSGNRPAGTVQCTAYPHVGIA